MRPETVILFDLDSTLCDTRHRWHLSPLSDPSSTWQAYAMACGNDTPIWGTLAAMRIHYPFHQIHICSNRPDAALGETIKWLDKNFVPYDKVNLVGKDAEGIYADPNRWCADNKIAYIHQLRREGLDPVLFYDDQVLVAEMIAEETAVPYVAVNPGYKETTFQGRL